MKSKIFISRKNIIKIITITLSIIGAVSGILGIYTYFYIPKADLNASITNTNVIDIRENVNKLKIIYDSIDIVKSKKNISIFLVELKNNGQDIRISDYDKNSLLGFKILNGQLLQKPLLINSSDNEYFKDVILNYNNKSLTLKQKIIDSEQFFKIKFLVLHDKEVKPTLVSFGKISGMEKLKINDNGFNSKKAYTEKILFIMMFIIFCFLVIFLKIYSNSTQIRNRVISQLNHENFLLREILKLRKDQN